MRIRTIEKLSENREFTPEGYLLCKGAALARTGAMRYLAEEVDPELMEGSNSREALLYREEKEVFDPGAMSSFEGKPLTLDHPDEDVDPDNWQELARGIVLNVRRGEGPENDLLLADILVTDAEAIELIREGLHELSCGYDTKLEIVKPGIGSQTRIRGNHVALVNRGRAGARCCIKDAEEKMAKKDNWFAKMRKLLKDAEAEAETKDNETERCGDLYPLCRHSLPKSPKGRGSFKSNISSIVISDRACLKRLAKLRNGRGVFGFRVSSHPFGQNQDSKKRKGYGNHP